MNVEAGGGIPSVGFSNLVVFSVNNNWSDGVDIVQSNNNKIVCISFVSLKRSEGVDIFGYSGLAK